MLHNLNRAFSSLLSAPAVKDIVFYNKMNDDMMFESNNDVIIYCNVNAKCIRLDWHLYPNMHNSPICAGEATPLMNYSWKITIPSHILKSGFYDVKVTLTHGNGEETRGICTFGYDADNIEVATYQSADFNVFWEKGLSKLKNIPLNQKMEESMIFKGTQIDNYNLTSACLPACYDPEGVKHEEVESLKVSFDGMEGKRIYGWLAKPKAKGTFPAMLVLPGAGNTSRPRPLEHARHGYLALDIQVHGFDVDLDEYPDIEYNEDTNSNPYYNIYLNCVQAINYLCSRNDVDKNRIVVVGGSQGGRLSLTTAALDNRINALVAGITHFSNIPYIKAAERNLDIKSSYKEFISESYCDVMNFAPNVKCATLMNVGLIDRVSPATGGLCFI